MKNLVLSMLVVGLAGSAFGSGFVCEDTKDAGFKVKLYNHTSGGTRVPATLIVSNENASPATQLVAKDEEISKTNRANTVRYTVDGTQMDLQQVILQISFKEGRENLEDGAITGGQLILVAVDRSRDVIDLNCSRYLKGE